MVHFCIYLYNLFNASFDCTLKSKLLGSPAPLRAGLFEMPLSQTAENVGWNVNEAWMEVRKVRCNTVSLYTVVLCTLQGGVWFLDPAWGKGTSTFLDGTKWCRKVQFAASAGIVLCSAGIFLHFVGHPANQLKTVGCCGVFPWKGASEQYHLGLVSMEFNYKLHPFYLVRLS